MAGPHDLLTEAHPHPSPVQRLDSRAKLLGLVGFTVVVVTTPAQAIWAFVLYAAILGFLIGLARLPLRYVGRRVLLVLPMVIVVAAFLPFFNRAGSGSFNVGALHVSGQGLLVLWNVAAKATLGVISMVLLAGTSSFAEMVAGLQALRAPRVFVLILSFMYRYSFVFVEEFARMRRALVARNYHARWLWNAAPLGHMLGSLFLRSYSRGERVYVAMLSRGYEGSVRLTSDLDFGARDAAFLAAVMAAAFAVRTLAAFIV